jgi:hypothetical protein
MGRASHYFGSIFVKQASDRDRISQSNYSHLVILLVLLSRCGEDVLAD